MRIVFLTALLATVASVPAYAQHSREDGPRGRAMERAEMREERNSGNEGERQSAERAQQVETRAAPAQPSASPWEIVAANGAANGLKRQTHPQFHKQEAAQGMTAVADGATTILMVTRATARRDHCPARATAKYDAILMAPDAQAMTCHPLM